MPERQLPVMRAATTGERAEDMVRDLYAALAEQPLGHLADLLGLSDLHGVSETFADPAYRDALKLGMAKGKGPARIGGAGARIAKNTQSGQGTPEQNMAKIPRFRSDLGTFIKHEGGWWRLPKQEGTGPTVRLERLPPGRPEPGQMPEILESKVISVDKLISGIREAKGVRDPASPQRRK